MAADLRKRILSRVAEENLSQRDLLELVIPSAARNLFFDRRRAQQIPRYARNDKFQESQVFEASSQVFEARRIVEGAE
jgi:hypothetical protein